MKIDNYQFPNSSFLSVEKDLEVIAEQMLKNQRLQKLLFYPVQDALEQPNLTPEQQGLLFEKNIKIVPQIVVDSEVPCYIIINFTGFAENDTNPEFRDCVIEFDIICDYSIWRLQGFSLRPYRIAAEIDTMLRNKRLTGAGKPQFFGTSPLLLDNELGGLTIKYLVLHGGEDKVGMPNPDDDIDYIKSFDETFNS